MTRRALAAALPLGALALLALPAAALADPLCSRPSTGSWATPSRSTRSG